MSEDDNKNIYPDPYNCAKEGCSFFGKSNNSMAMYKCYNPKMSGKILKEESCPMKDTSRLKNADFIPGHTPTLEEVREELGER